ncbi:MAG: tetratricopeptide repeat protein [Verrucomicrobia subdivision 3 bacterium]|nr:tetratricopeptide repeat protein [Limisphaerales bacterium]
MNTISFRALLWLGLALLLATGCSRDAKRAKYFQQAEAQFHAGDYDRAEIEYLNLLRLEPTNHVALGRMGRMAFEQGRTLRGFALLSEARKISPEDFEVRLRLAQVLLAGGKPKDARDEAVLLLARQPTNEIALLLLADASLTTNDVKDAQQRLANLSAVSGQIPGYHVAAATLQIRQRDLKAAEAAARQALTLDPQSFLAHGVMANLLVFNQDPTNALAEFKVAADLAPPRSIQRLRYADFLVAMGQLEAAKERIGLMAKQTPDYLPATLRVAEIALAERRFPDAEAAVKSLLARDPTHLEGLLLMARLQVAQNQPDAAVAALERALKVYPRLPQIHYQLAVIRLMQNDLAGAAKSLNQALANQPDYPEAILLSAELNVRRGDTSQAISELSNLVERRPDLTSAQFLLASAYRAAAKLEPALRIYQSLSRNSPTNPQPAFLIGLVQRQMDRNADARRSFEHVLTFAPGFLAAVEQLVGLDLAEKHSAAALLRAQAQVDQTPTNPAPYVLLAGVQLVETNLPAAEATLLKALAFAPEYGPANALLARIYVTANKHPAALKTLNEMVARNTNDLASWLKIAELHSAASNYPAAKQTYEKALAVNPRYVPVLNNLAWLAAVRLGDLKLAYELGSKAHDLRPADPFTSDTFGWVLYLRGDYPRSLALITESAKALPQEPEVQFHLGMAHYMMGEEAPARVALQNALQLAREGDWRSDAAQRLRLLDLDPASADVQTVGELKAMSARSPEDPILLLRQAAIADRDGNWDQAATYYSNALKINPNLVTATIKLSQLLATKLHNPPKALELARRARELSPDDPVITHTLGRLAYDAGDFSWAASLLQESLRRLPKDAAVQFDFGLAAYSLGQVTNATAAVQAALDGGLPPPQSERAKTFVRMQSLLSNPGQADAAAAQIQELLKQQPDYVPAWMVFAAIQDRKGDFAAARDSYTRVLKAMPEFAPADRQLALLYYTRLQLPTEAYAHALKAREAFPQDREIARLLGILSYQRGEFSRAGQLLQEASASFPNDSEVIYRLGLTQYKLKQSQESRRNLAQALGLAPNSEFAPEAKRVLADLK